MDLKLKYPESFFREQEKFPYYYETIKELLEDPNTIVIGYSTDNDVRYILTELLYYELKPINFKYYDVQEIFDDEFGFYDCISLSNASELLGLNKQDDEHDSLSDAKMTMDICKKLTIELDLPFNQILAKYEIREFKDYRIQMKMMSQYEFCHHLDYINTILINQVNQYHMLMVKTFAFQKIRRR